jgi:DivIVA domain-containing protein
VDETASLSPEEIRAHSFNTSVRRGFDRDEVSAFLAEVAEAYRGALEKAEQGPTEHPTFEQLGHEAASLLQAAQEGAESLRRRGEAEAESIRLAARQEADEIRAQGDRDAAGVRDGAAGEAEKTLREAELVARRLRNATERQCNDLLGEAAARAQQLERHEQEIEERIRAVEQAFLAFRTRAEDAAAAREELEVAADELSVEQDAEEPSSTISLQVESVQPKPIFDS